MTTDMLRCALRGVAAYRPVVDEPVMRLALGVLDKLSAGDGSGAVEDYARLFYALRSAGSRSLGEWLDGRLRDRESPYAALAERGGEDPALEAAARRDIETFTLLAELDWDQVLAEVGGKAPREYGPVLANLPRWRGSSPFSFAELTEFYRANGAGLFARHRAFLWEDGALCPVEQPDCPGADEMLGYELQRNRVIANTRAMLEGNLVNNVLLYGDSGTGKSATVKNLLTLPGFEALRLIEVQKEGLADLPRLIRALGGRRLKFILFIDDLAFDQDDKTYSALKTILEGGLERRPANVAVYATSNRRRLVRQTFSDRAGDEVDASETIQEKTSLSDRFGLRIPYLALNQAEFLELVEGMEIMDGPELIRKLKRGDLLTINQTRYVLVEVLPDAPAWQVYRMLDHLLEEEYYPVLAHPERYRCVQKTPAHTKEWADMGCTLQIDKGSIFGRFGEAAMITAEYLLQRRLAHLAASDAHRADYRTMELAALRDFLGRHYGSECPELLLRENPGRILRGKAVIRL